MIQYIDKDAVMAEIISLKVGYECGWNCAIDKIVEHIDNLEVKEVDLEKELIKWHKEHFKKDGTFIGISGFYLTNNSQMNIAKHFFELGLKAQKS